MKRRDFTLLLLSPALLPVPAADAAEPIVVYKSAT